MPITTPNTTPANYSDPAITRYGLISGLNIVNVHAYNQYYDFYGFAPYGALSQMMGNEEKSLNKEFRWYQSHGRPLGFVTTNAAVTVANGAPATITLGTGSYSQSGTKSLGDLGFIFYNSRTGVNVRVSTVPNKATPNAHTMQITPVLAAENASVLAGDELLGRGYLYLGEQSDKTATIIRNTDRYANFCTQIRADDTFGDLAGAEKIEFQVNGNYSYVTKQQKDTDIRIMRELDLLLFEGTRTDNLPYVEEGTSGVIKQVQANGIDGTGVWSMAQFATLDRAFNAVGAPKEYDILADGLAYQAQQNSIFTEVNNGAIVYASEAGTRGGIDIKRDFKSLTIYSRKYNFTNFGLFDEQTMYGSSGLGARSNFALFMPQGKTSSNTESGGTVTVPRFTVMYQTPFNTNKWHTGETGLFAEGGATSTKAEKVGTTIGYFGPRCVGVHQYAIIKG